MSEQADRDALAEVIGGHFPQSRGAGRWPGCFSHPRIEDWTPDHLAGAILASDWLAQRDRRVAAEALREAAESADDRWCDEVVDEVSGWLRERADQIERGE